MADIRQRSIPAWVVVVLLVGCAALIALGRLLLIMDAWPGGWVWFFVTAAIVVAAVTTLLARVSRSRRGR